MMNEEGSFSDAICKIYWVILFGSGGSARQLGVAGFLNEIRFGFMDFVLDWGEQ